MAEEPSENRVPDEPRISAGMWYGWAVGGFILAAAFFAVAALWVFNGDLATVQQRAQAVTPFGAALIAMVTFFTVAWRGVQTERQLQYQAEQITQVIRQNDAKEQENLAKLLQDGAKLMSDSEHFANMSAGISSLEALLNADRNNMFAKPAMNVLADFYARNYAETNPITELARTALISGRSKGFESSVIGHFQDLKVWPEVSGFRAQFYKEGRIYGNAFRTIANEAKAFEGVQFFGCKDIDGTTTFIKCTFRQCSIKLATEELIFADNTFIECDFSKCGFLNVSEEEIKMIFLKKNRNFYYKNTPPFAFQPLEWDVFLEERDAASVRTE